MTGVRVTFIGTGGASSRRYGHTNALVEAGGMRLMIDFGFLTPSRLERYGHSLGQITHVAVSHIHADHVGGLEELAFASRFLHRRKPTLLLPRGLGRELWEQSLRGGLERVSDNRGKALRCTLDSYFDCVDLGAEWCDLGPMSIRPFRTDHVPDKNSWGFIVRDGASGSKMIFGCDTRTRQPELLEDPLSEDFAAGPIFHDCLLADHGLASIHIHLRKIIYDPTVQERIVLVHYGDDLEDHLPAIRTAGLKVTFPGEVIRLADWRSCVH